MLSHRLRHRVAFEKKHETQDPETGSVLIEWVGAGNYLDSVPAEVLTGPGRESISTAAVNAETTARINVRWFPGLDQAWRIVWDGRIYNIITFDTDITGRREWRIQCSEGLNDG